MEVYLTMLYSSAVLYIVMLHKVVIAFASVNEILKCDYIFERVNLLGSSSLWYCLRCCYRVVLTFEYVGKTLL